MSMWGISVIRSMGSAKTLKSGINLEKKILLIRDKRVMIDHDLSTLYGVSTKRLNEQVKRNLERFPDNFMFQLTQHLSVR